MYGKSGHDLIAGGSGDDLLHGGKRADLISLVDTGLTFEELVPESGRKCRRD
ncbi:MAG: hypothetical protein KJP02_12380 [Octadecabacter sp.]|nr:hypothetical protein [Octadecabacter sp.]